jgi:uncharacterized membrane protein YfcA
VSTLTIVALILAVAVGISLGLLGSGGSIVMLPVLVYVSGVPAQEAVSMSLVIVGGTSLVGAILRFRQGNYHLKATILFTVSGMVGAYFGASLTHLVSQTTLMMIFSGLMLIVGAAMIFEKRKVTGDRDSSNVRLLLVGTCVGVLTGFLGVGGGFLIVPALVLFAGIELNKAIGASMAIIAFNSVAGVLGHAQRMTIDWRLTGLFLLAALVGMVIGNQYSARVPEKHLKKVFAWFVVTVAVVIAVINIYGLLAPHPMAAGVVTTT